MDSDEQYLDELYRKYYPLLQRVALSVSRNPNYLEDIIHETWIGLIGKVDVLRGLNQYKRTSYVVTSCQRAAVWYCRKAAKDCKHWVTLEEQEELPEDSVRLEDLLELRERMDAVTRRLSQLPAQDQQILRFRFILELSYKEIAETYEIREGNARQQVSRAKKRLLKLMREVEGE